MGIMGIEEQLDKAIRESREVTEKDCIVSRESAVRRYIEEDQTIRKKISNSLKSENPIKEFYKNILRDLAARFENKVIDGEIYITALLNLKMISEEQAKSLVRMDIEYRLKNEKEYMSDVSNAYNIQFQDS
ncbi:hypothetical protein KY330_02475 [Candidatus Woesearchaeota archaeon]|nr:hypothetical protein [Candidatus Woesearchaeota archaeon]